jgi:hypothetical protein
MTRMISRSIVIATVAALLLAACAAPRPHAPRELPATPEAIRAAVTATAAALPHYHQITGRWQNEQTTSTYHAYFSGPHLEYVTESAGDGDKSYAVNKYYYVDGVLYYFHGQGSVGSGDSFNPQPAEIDVQIAFDAAGRVTRSVKTLNGRSAALEKGEAAAILEHAGELRRDATATLANQAG